MIKIYIFVVFISLLCCINCTNEESLTFFRQLKTGFRIAGKILGTDKESGVAQLVSEAFRKTDKKGNIDGIGSNVFSGFFRILGFDTKKIEAIAINAFIFLAQLISSSLLTSRLEHARKKREGSPLDWMMNNTEVINIISFLKDKELPNKINNYVKEKSALIEETDCIQLLICKASPFIWGMQEALNYYNETKSVKGKKALFAYFPEINKVVHNADLCNNKHSYCFIKF